MEKGAITEQFDVALLAFNVFFLFFLGLVAYLHRESKREGYPLVNNRHQAVGGGLFGVPAPKSFALADGTTLYAPHGGDDEEFAFKDNVVISANSRYPASPQGNVLGDGVGPGAYTMRRDVPDVNFEGHDRVVPMRNVQHFIVAEEDPDPRGAGVYGCDGEEAGVVQDIWVDISETVIRYYEVALSGAAGRVLVPANMVDIDKRLGVLKVDAITGGQFAQVPRTANPDRVTLREEDKIMGYYGAGYMYATPRRQEPFV
jgi:photosynthetic reaction center H subunit